MIHPLNQDPHGKPSSEQEYGTKHPGRYEPRQRTLGNTEQQQRMRALVYASGNTTVTTGGAGVVVALAATVFDTAGIKGTNRLTVPSTGRITGSWLFYGQVQWNGNSAGTVRRVQIRKNGTTVIATAKMQPVTNDQTQVVSVLINDPTAGDYFELLAFQDSGADRTINSGQDLTYLEAIHLW